MVLDKITKGISGAIGLGQEAIQHQKDKKAAEQSSTENDTNSTANLEDNDDEDDWIADDAQAQLEPSKPQDDETDKDSAQHAIEWFKSRHPPLVKMGPSVGRLPAPVVVPQKRPEMRSRGFVRAYAPALEESQVSQAAFLDFIDGFEKEIKKHNWFNAGNLAIALSVLSFTAAVAPSAVVKFSALAVHISIEAGRRAYISKKSNTYLDELNAYYFQPRGLYAMIMMYKPGSKEPGEVLDFEAMAAAAVDTRTGEEKSQMQDYRASSGKTLDQQMPECCPLIFPDLERASGEEKEGAFKRSLEFTRSYYDRRNRAEFATKNPDSKLNVQDQEFAGKHGHPSSFEGSSLLGVVTGGKIDPRRQRWEKKNRLRQEVGLKPAPAGQGVVKVPGKGMIKRALGDNVLYLMIVNMPTGEELQAAKEMEQRMKREEPNWVEKFMAQRSSVRG